MFGGHRQSIWMNIVISFMYAVYLSYAVVSISLQQSGGYRFTGQNPLIHEYSLDSLLTLTRVYCVRSITTAWKEETRMAFNMPWNTALEAAIPMTTTIMMMMMMMMTATTNTTTSMGKCGTQILTKTVTGYSPLRP